MWAIEVGLVTSKWIRFLAFPLHYYYIDFDAIDYKWQTGQISILFFFLSMSIFKLRIESIDKGNGQFYQAPIGYRISLKYWNTSFNYDSNSTQFNRLLESNFGK